jgi:plasmid stabilization system protein ParE
MHVRLSHAAERELEEIGNFIANDNPLRAASFVQELVERCYGLADHSKRYSVVTTWHGLEIRRCPYRHYLIFYVLDERGLEIAHIIHGSRDYLTLLLPDD